MSQLAEKIRRARESSVEAGGHRFTIRRPTDAEAMEISGGMTGLDLVRRHVVGWDLKFIDLYPGGDPTPAPFEPDAWAEWVADRPQIWEPLTTAIMEAYQAHRSAQGDAAKN